MNIYLISQDVNRGYDTYDSAIVLAESVALARQMCPSGYKTPFRGSWCDPSDVKVELIGKANKKFNEPQVICSSFNAG